MAATFREICALEGEDGIVFDPTSVKTQEIRKEANYAGIRITLTGLLDVLAVLCKRMFDSAML